MNLILLFPSDFIAPNRVRFTDRRYIHIQEILKSEVGQTLTVGQVNGLIGQGTIVRREESAFELEVTLDQTPPKPLPLTLIMALPRPPMLRRVLFSAAMLGVKKIIILNFNRVEKSLWNSSSLTPEVIKEQLILGLEQAKDTLLPEVILKKHFKPFVQDELSVMIQGSLPIVLHPGSSQAMPPQVTKPVILVIGPEGGIIDYEIAQLEAIGFQTIGLGTRILRVESVLPYVVGKLF